MNSSRWPRVAQSRAAWLAAWGRDLLTLAAASALSALVAVLWMLARTDRGRYDLGTWDAIGALSLCAAVAPAWSAWRWLRLGDHRATELTRSTDHESEPPPPASPPRRWLLTALHPALLPLWLWATAMLMITGLRAFAFVAVLPFTMFLTGGSLMLGSVVVLLLRPSAAPLHEWFARASFGRGP